MDIYRDETYVAFRESVQRFAREHVAPYAAAVDREARPPIEALQASLALGLPGLPFPEEFGGQGGDLATMIITMEEVARVCASTAITLSSCWIMLILVKRGTQAQKELVIPSIVSGKIRTAWGLTEPKGGSDLMGVTSKAQRTADGWVLNGTKRFITNGGWADWYLIFARTTEKQFGIFLVHKDDPGISFGVPERKMGVRGSPTSDVILDNCVIPEDRLIGDPEQGQAYINDGLLTSRLKYSAHALGVAQGCLDQAIPYTLGRQQFGKPIASFQMLRGMVADMAIKVEAARSVLYRAVDQAMSGDSSRTLASMAKVLCSDAAMSVATDAVQLHGGYGYLEDYPVERMMRDAKITQIWEGTNQIQRLMIAKDVYGKYAQ